MATDQIVEVRQETTRYEGFVEVDQFGKAGFDDIWLEVRVTADGGYIDKAITSLTPEEARTIGNALLEAAANAALVVLDD